MTDTAAYTTPTLREALEALAASATGRVILDYVLVLEDHGWGDASPREARAELDELGRRGE